MLERLEGLLPQFGAATAIVRAILLLLLGRVDQERVADLIEQGDLPGALDVVNDAARTHNVPVAIDSAAVLSMGNAPPEPEPTPRIVAQPVVPDPVPVAPSAARPKPRRGADAVDPAARLSGLLDQQEARIATVFRTAVAALKDEVNLGELADLIQQGRTDEALGKLQEAADRLGVASNVAFITSGQSTATFLATAGVGRVVFDQVNTNAVAAMQANRLELVREFTNEQRRATSLALVTGVEAGSNPIEQARNFRDSIGLTESQWRAVANYRASLEGIGQDDGAQAVALGRALRDRRGDSQILRAIREGKALPKEKVDWLVERYTARYVKYRSQVIGRTEALRAVHEGTEEMYRQAIADGTLDPDKLERKWVTSIDGRERRTHKFLHGQKRGWGGVWTTQNGTIRYPGDPDAPAAEVIQCRCVLTTRIRQA